MYKYRRYKYRRYKYRKYKYKRYKYRRYKYRRYKYRRHKYRRYKYKRYKYRRYKYRRYKYRRYKHKDARTTVSIMIFFLSVLLTGKRAGGGGGEVGGVGGGGPIKSGEFCERESFEASCADDEVILMRSAVYGRMNFGKCVQTEYSSIGCSANVLGSVDSWCSGRQQCRFAITDLHDAKPCPRELIAYLEAS